MAISLQAPVKLRHLCMHLFASSTLSEFGPLAQRRGGIDEELGQLRQIAERASQGETSIGYC